MKKLAAIVLAAVTILALVGPAGAATGTSTSVACSNNSSPATVTSTAGKIGVAKITVDNSCNLDWIQVTVLGTGGKVAGIVNFPPGTFTWDAHQLSLHHIRGGRIDAQLAPLTSDGGTAVCEPVAYPNYDVTPNRVFDCNQTTAKKGQIVKTTEVFRCANGKVTTFHHEGWQRTPEWWVVTSETIDNRCASQWLVVESGVAYSETSCCVIDSYAPGAHVHLQNAKGIGGHFDGAQHASLQPTAPCPGFGAYNYYDAKGRITQPPPCPASS